MDGSWREYEQVLVNEEILWFQKSRLKWLVFGDHNTKLFHSTTIIQRRKNKDETIQKDDGSWVSNPNELKELVVCCYKFFFRTWFINLLCYRVVSISDVASSKEILVTI